MIPRTGPAGGPLAVLAAGGLLLVPRPDGGRPVVVPVADLIAELERRVAADEPPLRPRRHLRLVPPPA